MVWPQPRIPLSRWGPLRGSTGTPAVGGSGHRNRNQFRQQADNEKMRTTTPGNGPSTQTLPGSPPSRTGSMYCPDSVAALHQRILRGPRLEHIRPHDLRHTVTLALQKHSGAPDGKLSFPAGALQFFRGMSRDVRLPFKVRNLRICTTVNAAMASYLFQAEAQNQ